RFKHHRFWTVALPFSPEGKLLASGGTGTAVQLWDPATGNEVRRLALPSPPGNRLGGRDFRPRRLTLVMAVAFSPDGKTLAAGDGEGKVTFWDPATGRKRGELTALPREKLGIFGLCALAYSPDGKTLASAGGGGQVRLWETMTRKERLRLRDHGRKGWSVAFAADGRTLAASGADGYARVWHVPPAERAR